MIKKIAFVFTLAVIMSSATFAQDKVKVSETDVILKVKVGSEVESSKKALANAEHCKLANTESNVFYMVTTADKSESAMKEIKHALDGVEMKVLKLTGEEYLKNHTKK